LNGQIAFWFSYGLNHHRVIRGRVDRKSLLKVCLKKRLSRAFPEKAGEALFFRGINILK